ncbi:MAG: C45 family peptidase [Candidatus Bathyarchaeia archaeon]
MSSDGLLNMELSGSPYERGYKYGVACKDRIASLLEVDFYKEFDGKLPKEQMIKHARKYIPFIEDYSPEITEELKGIADGSERLFEEIIMINALEEKESFEKRECTAFAVTSKSTINGETYYGQNWDGLASEWLEGKISLLFKVRRKNGPDILNYTNPGILSCAGINSYGLGISWTSVPRLELKPGVPTYIIVAEVLRQKTIGDALDAVLKADRAGCFHFIIADETEIYSIEATPKDVDIDYSDTFVVHTNHYISEKFYAKQNIAQLKADTFVRYNRMKRLIKENFGKITLRTCMDLLRDHVNYPSSICKHPDERANEKFRGLTLDSWVIVPTLKEFWLAHGSPCRNEYIKYTF